jgi:hypothetical protein
MPLKMNDWLRSLTVLAVSFAGVVALTLGLAVLIVPAPVGSSEVSDGASPRASATPALLGDLDAIPTAIGGTLLVTGDREASLVVDRESTDGQYGLVGDDARIFLVGDPLTVVQMNLDGLSFFPEPDACTITPGRHNQEIGVASAGLRCEDLADVRGSGVVDVEAVLGIAADVLGMRGDLPPMGGSLAFGEQTLTFTEAWLFPFFGPVQAGDEQTNMGLVDGTTGLYFTYDVHTHATTLSFIEIEGEITEVPASACTIATREIGKVNPRNTLVEMTMRCPAVELPDLGSITIDGTVLVEQLEAPF